MKRPAPSASSNNRSYVQQPVSCQFCRSRKLKCDRGRPCCFNCRSRDKDCIYPVDRGQPKAPAPAPAPAPVVAAAPALNNAISYPREPGLDLAERVARLERAVFSRNEPSEAQDQLVPISNEPLQHTDSQPLNHDEEQQKTSQWLEGLLTEDTPGASPASLSAKVDIATIIRDLPSFQDATTLLHHYTKTIDATYRVLHIPTTWRMLDALYRELGANHIPSATQLSFFLCIFAGSVYVSRTKFQFESHSLQGHSQPALAELWARHAVMLLTDPPVPASVTALQTFASLGHLCSQMEGLRKHFNVLTMPALQMARVMKLHCLDSPSSCLERRKNGADMVDVEVKRRVWWHMTASDWLMSYNGGPNEGTYLLHPNQMEVSYPSNIEDADIPHGITYLTEESYNSPLSHPTSLTYFIYRIHYATLVREIVDTLPVSFFSSPAMESCDEIYDKVEVLDRKYQTFIKSLPPFFQLEVEDTADYRALIQRQPYLEWQRFLFNFALHTQLARLHRPFLIRGSRHAKYAASRLQCIKSAEIVISIQKSIMHNHSIGSFTYVLQHLLNAAIILAMDVCFNPDKVHAPRREQYVMDACRSLEEDLKAKLVPIDPDVDDRSSGQAMVQSFQNAVRNLQGLMRRNVCDEEPYTDKVASAKNFDAPSSLAAPASQKRRITTRSNSSFPKPDSAEQSVPDGFTNDFNAGAIGGLNYTNNEQVTDPFAPGDIVMDKLWDDFLTIGSTFNDTDWDSFFRDVDAHAG